MTTEQEALARKWARKVLDGDVLFEPGQREAAAQYILDTLKLQDMSDTQWSNVEHYLQEAHHETAGNLIMVYEDESDEYGNEYIACAGAGKAGAYPKFGLFPTGRRYKLILDEQADHTQTLETVEDYENAPIGTIVAPEELWPLIKTDNNEWRKAGTTSTFESRHMPPITRRVLRWGWGE